MIQREQGTIKEKIIIYLIGAGVAGYLSLLCAASWVPGCTLSEWLNNFMQFIIMEHHFIVGFSKMTPYVFALFEFVWLIIYMVMLTKIQHPYSGREYGDAHWGDVASFTKDYANHNKAYEVEVNFGDCKAPSKPVIVNTHNYWMAEGCYLNIDNKLTSNLNWLIVGPPGTGKSFRVARPVLSQLAGNFLVTDPKGELSKQTGQFFEDNGYKVMVLNVESEEGMEHSIHFNPFRYLRNESDIMSLAQILFKATTDPEQSGGDDAFFENSAETLLTDLLYLMHYTYPDQDKDWRHFVDLLESTIVKANEKTGAIDNSDPNGILNRFEQANANWKEGMYTSGKKQTSDLKGLVDIRKFYSGAQETTSSIVASLDAHCRYMKLQCVQDLLSEDEIDITNSFGYCKKTKKSPTGKSILFIVTSEDKRYYDWITSMVYSLFFDELYHLTAIDPSLHETLPEHLTFLMDEFANITLPDSFVDKLSTMRSRGMSAIVIIQNVIQLKKKFPKFDLDKNLIGNMSITEILGGPDPDSCEYLTKLFGKMTIHKQTTGLSRGGQGSFSENEDVMEKPLFSADEMYDMDKDGPCAIRVKGTSPLWVPKVQFQNSPLLPLLTRKTPYRPKDKVMVSKMKFDYSKSPCEQIPDIYVGKEADSFLRQCEDEGVRVVNITLEDVDALATLEREKVPITGENASTKEFWEQIRKNSKEALEKKKASIIDFDSYGSDEKMLLVQRLRKNGFSVVQIRALDSLIQSGSSFEEIDTYFNNEMSVNEIRNFADRLVKAKQKTKFVYQG